MVTKWHYHVGSYKRMQSSKQGEFKCFLRRFIKKSGFATDMRLAILFSSGKDSTYTLHTLKEEHEIVCLLCLIPANPDSFMFQQSKRELVEAQAASLGLPVMFRETAGKKEEELADLEALLKKAKADYKIEGIGSGALASTYQFERIGALCKQLGLESLAPLWQQDQHVHFEAMVKEGFDIRMTRIAAMGLDESWLGRKLAMEDLETLKQLRDKLGFHPAGEGGEFETIVLDGPGFAHPIHIDFEKKMESKERGELLITDIKHS